jgi:hypothetical protein
MSSAAETAATPARFMVPPVRLLIVIATAWDEASVPVKEACAAEPGGPTARPARALSTEPGS